jgi:hypothetical protein
MRAHIVLAALQTQNRFTLCHLAFKSIRMLHKPSTRIQDTTNDVLQRLAGTESPQIAPVGEIGAIPVENKREKSAIASQAGGPPAEPLAEAGAVVILSAESPESQLPPSVPRG